MKKSLVALAVLGAFAGVASAQSSVTLFGIVDTNIQRVAGSGNGSVTRLHEGGVATSRYGIKGEEDLGGGLKASFWLEGQMQPDDGTLQSAVSTNNSAAATSTAIFGRRSTVSLSGNFGEVRLGRDYLPDYLLISGFSAFGINGSAGTIAQNCTGLALPTAGGFTTPCVTNVRASNSVQYFLPSNLGGVYGSLMYAFGEQASTAVNDKDGRVVAGRVGYKVGGLDATIATSKATYYAGDLKRVNAGASYTFGAFKPILFWNKVKVAPENGGASATPERKDWGLGLVATFGQNVVRATYQNYDVKNTDNDAKLLGVGYMYNMSKRTSLYANYGRVDNDGTGTAFATAAGRTPTEAGGNSTGYEIGVSHSF